MKNKKYAIVRRDQTISSLQNEKVKDVVRLRQRVNRDRRGMMVVEDCRELERALESGRRPLALFYCHELFSGRAEQLLIGRCRETGAEIIACAPPVFAKMAYRENPGGILAVLPQNKLGLADIKLSPAPLVIVAEAVEKPGNLGTILRSADAAGADAVIVCDRCTDIHNPNVIRASIGAVFTVPVAEAPSRETLEWLRVNKIQIVAASPHASLEYTRADFRRGTAFIVGKEQHGLSRLWLEASDDQVAIPMHGRIDSLNVAASATILLFEAVRQRGAKR